jgi:hypothetical protein
MPAVTPNAERDTPGLGQPAGQGRLRRGLRDLIEMFMHSFGRGRAAPGVLL